MRNTTDKPRQLRTCQECKHKAFYAVPPTAGFADTLCRRCRSTGLDFGNTVQPGADSNARYDKGEA